MKVETLNMDAIDLQDDGSRYVSELLLENVSICRLVSMEMDKWEEINIIDFILKLNNFIGVISLSLCQLVPIPFTNNGMDTGFGYNFKFLEICRYLNIEKQSLVL